MNSPRGLRSVLSTEDERLSCFDVDVFHLNQRQSLNPLYIEIKESILAKGVQEPLHVIFHPELDRWVLSQGGQTRLQICRELYEESKDEMFLFPPIIRKKFTSDLELVVSHLVENNLRGENSFYETSMAVVNIRKIVTQELGQEPTQEELVSVMETRGLPIRRQSITSMIYLIDVLSPRISNKKFLGSVSRKAMDSIRSLRNELSADIPVEEFDNKLVSFINEQSDAASISKIKAFFTTEETKEKKGNTPTNHGYATQLSLACGLGDIIHGSDELFSGFYVSLPEAIQDKKQAELCFVLTSLSGAFEEGVSALVHEQMGLANVGDFKDVVRAVKERLDLDELDLVSIHSRVFMETDEESFENLVRLIAGVRTTFNFTKNTLEK